MNHLLPLAKPSSKPVVEFNIRRTKSNKFMKLSIPFSAELVENAANKPDILFNMRSLFTNSVKLSRVGYSYVLASSCIVKEVTYNLYKITNTEIVEDRRIKIKKIYKSRIDRENSSIQFTFECNKREDSPKDLFYLIFYIKDTHGTSHVFTAGLFNFQGR